jgi:hypothetical protein
MFVDEQQINTKFCVLLHKSPVETLTMLQQEYGDREIRKSKVYDWYFMMDVRMLMMIYTVIPHQ